MSSLLNGKFVVAVSSTALFDLREEDQIFRERGPEAYMETQWARQNMPLPPGPAFTLIKKLLDANQGKPENQAPVEVLLLSRNDPCSGLRIMNAIRVAGLGITRAAFTNGRSPWGYLGPLNACLFLSTHPEDARSAARAGVAAAVVLPGSPVRECMDAEIRIALDGDCVLFGGEAEEFFQKQVQALGREQGIAAFNQREHDDQDLALPRGPFMGFLEGLQVLKHAGVPIRTGLFTARNAPAHARPIKTLQKMGVNLDEVVFLGGVEKAAMVHAWGADFFLDDQERHCLPASQFVPTGHVVGL